VTNLSGVARQIAQQVELACREIDPLAGAVRLWVRKSISIIADSAGFPVLTAAASPASTARTRARSR